MMNNAESEVVQKTTDFGSVLASSRKAQNLSLEEVYEHLKIPVHVLKEIEANDIESLPASAFTLGYLRAYARYLEISEENVLEIYKRAVPHEQAADLSPRSKLPGEASSQSPLIKFITILLVLAGIAAVLFGSYQYYQKKAGVMEVELESKQQRFTGNSLDSPGGQQITIKQNARITDDDELIVGPSDTYDSVDSSTDDALEEQDSVISEPAVSEPVISEPVISKPVDSQPAVSSSAEAMPVIEVSADSGDRPAVAENDKDIIEIYAEKGSWVQVRDASNTRLLYNTVPVGGRKVLVGRAPFSVSMGNAASTRVVLNGLEIDLSNFIGPKNIAKFKVSTQGQSIIFH